MKTKFLLKTLLTSLVFSLILFLAAGKIDYIQGYFFLTTNILTGLLNFWFIRNNVDLMQERSKVGENTKGWDKKILGISALVYLLNVVLAGLDSGRFQWSPEFPLVVNVSGILINFFGQLIFLNARKQNHFFSSVVRIQNDRDHLVCEQGLYSFVRHPGYLGMIVSLLSVPLITGSIWSFASTGIAIVLLLIRTQLEDKTLKQELKGYEAYTTKTKYRLIPGIW